MKNAILAIDAIFNIVTSSWLKERGKSFVFIYPFLAQLVPERQIARNCGIPAHQVAVIKGHPARKRAYIALSFQTMPLQMFKCLAIVDENPSFILRDKIDVKRSSSDKDIDILTPASAEALLRGHRSDNSPIHGGRIAASLLRSFSTSAGVSSERRLACQPVPSHEVHG